MNHMNLKIIVWTRATVSEEENQKVFAYETKVKKQQTSNMNSESLIFESFFFGNTLDIYNESRNELVMHAQNEYLR